MAFTNMENEYAVIYFVFLPVDVLCMGRLGPQGSCQELSRLHLCFRYKPSNWQQIMK